MAEKHIEANHAVLVADGHDGYVTRDVVFALYHLLRRLRDLGAVGERQIAGNLLFEGNCWRGPSRRGFGIQPIRINFDSSNTKEAL